jgi:nitronate monooxygenase
MWQQTAFTKLMAIDLPIVQGPFGGGLSSVELTVAVSNRGGLGSFGAQPLDPEQIIATSEQIKSRTNKPYAINLWVSDRDKEVDTYSAKDFEKVLSHFKPLFEIAGINPPALPRDLGASFEKQVEAVLSASPPVFSFIYGIPSKEILAQCKKQNIKTIGTATSVDEAVALAEAGVDAVVASGFEAGGHRASFLKAAEDSLTGLVSLVPQVADSISIPVIAAGGIADGRGIAAALALGAEAVQIGTAFLACAESNASDDHRTALFSQHAKHTTLTKTVSGRLARAISNDITAMFQHCQEDMAPYPLQRILMATLQKALLEKNQRQYQTFWSGQSAALLKHKTVAELITSLVAETDELIKTLP